MPQTSLLPVLLGLAAALTWGAGDFAGGIASRRSNPIRVVLAAEWIGGILLIPLPFLFHEPLPPTRDLLYSIVASLLGSVGLILLYRSLAEGKMSIAAPVSALLAAVLPVVVGAWTQGFPGIIKLVGFLLALAAIWLISGGGVSPIFKAHLASLRLPLISGITFGFYFILMHAASQQATFWPLLSARLASSVGLSLYVLMRPPAQSLPRKVMPIVVVCGAMDVTANLMYVLAGQAGRLDIAAVLGSLYPGTTVILAWFLLKERINRLQAVGIVAALSAIVLIAS
ncbi:MAG: DMT family transporter [Anaerolineales bacterium]|nr:DMT family transporter [Anaerolineales bacterium]